MEHDRVTRFEDLRAWQHARQLANAIYDLTRSDAMRRDFGLCDQMRRAAVSVMSNIAEGHERGSSQEYHRFLSIAKGSCAELRAQLYLALDLEYIDQPTFQRLIELADSTARLIGALRSSIARHISTQRQ